jgi:hypothetical protein
LTDSAAVRRVVVVVDLVRERLDRLALLRERPDHVGSPVGERRSAQRKTVRTFSSEWCGIRKSGSTLVNPNQRPWRHRRQNT